VPLQEQGWPGTNFSPDGVDPNAAMRLFCGSEASAEERYLLFCGSAAKAAWN